MSFGSKPQVVDNSPWTNMPDWVKTYYQNQIARASQSDNRADALRQMYSGFTPQERRFVEGYQTSGSNQAVPMAQTQSTQTALSRLLAGSGGGSDGMWSDGMTGPEVRAHQEAGTYGNTSTTSRTPQQEYDRQMDSYTRSGGGISVGGGNTAAEAMSNALR
jgi:hypothetical protein